MTEEFRVRVAVRDYEIDANGHVAGAVLLQYGQHARWECLRAAGINHAELRAAGIGPVSLEENIRYHRELRAGEEVDVTCRYVWGDGKTFRIEQDIRHTDGTLVAEITNVGGLLDHAERRLLAEPSARWRSAAAAPELLGLGNHRAQPVRCARGSADPRTTRVDP